ncbi:MAG: 4Fe-4S binding protein [Caldilineaceae bacterium]|nr:4Fe-4S binding protein [Caldilineaceae bacterium]
MTLGPLPQINQELCTGCGKCVDVCPTGTLALEPFSAIDEGVVGTIAGNGGAKAVLRHPERCTYCLACEDICPANAIALPFQVIIAKPQGGAQN